MSSPYHILVRVFESLDRHKATTGAKASILRLVRTQHHQLDGYLLNCGLDEAFGRSTGLVPMFDGVVVELVDAEHCLSVSGSPAEAS